MPVPRQEPTGPDETLEARFARWKHESAGEDVLWEWRGIATATVIGCAIAAWLAAAIYLG
jgi:hypothetical protein